MKVRMKCAMTFMAIAAMTFCGLMQRELTEKTPFTEPAGAEGELAGQDLIEGTELTVPVEDTETDQ